MVKRKLKKYGYKLIKFFVPDIILLKVLKNDLDFEPITSVYYNCKIAEHTKIGSPVHIYQSVVGAYTYLSTNSYVNQTTIGKFCSIGPNFLCGWGIHPTNGISTAPMFYSSKKQNGMTLSLTDKIEERKPIKIGNDVFIGANVTVLDGVTIGDGAVIGAGAVVSKDIPAYAVAVGCPIQIIKFRFDEPTIESLLRIKWWEFEDEKLIDIEKLFFQVDEFIQKYDVKR